LEGEAINEARVTDNGREIIDEEEAVNVGEMLGLGGGIIGHGQIGLVVINGCSGLLFLIYMLVG